MTFYVENENRYEFPFSVDALFEQVALSVLEAEKCPYESAINLVITDNEGIREYNRQYREIDRETDVLSFPGVDYDAPADFSRVESDLSDYFDPETGELMLGDMIISYEKAKEQADQFGHSFRREMAFLIAHSMFHLCGYDHMTPEDAVLMEEKQEAILEQLGITRDMNE